MNRFSFFVFRFSPPAPKSPERDFGFGNRMYRERASEWAYSNTPLRWVILMCCLLFFCQFSSQAQSTAPSPYQLKWQKELPLTLIPAVGLGISLRLGQTKPLLTEAGVAQLDVNKIPKFDRFAVNKYSVSAHRASDIFLYGSALLPVVFLLDKNIRPYAGETSVICLQTFLLTTAVTTLTKEIFQRKRPFVYNPDVPFDKKRERDATASFFSGHTSVTASSSFLFAQMFNDFYPNSNARYLVWTGAALAPAITGFLRMKGGKHFLSDVVVGYLVGGAIGILIPRLHHRK